MPVPPLFPVSRTPFFLLACSPRPGGNTDAAARFFLEGFTRTHTRYPSPHHGAGIDGEPAEALAPTFLRSYRVDPCISCYACKRAAERWKQGPGDTPPSTLEPSNCSHGKCRGTETAHRHSEPTAPPTACQFMQRMQDDPVTVPRSSLPALAFGCPLTLKDDSIPLLHALCTADSMCIVSPIYFYHLPAMFKALIDRTQPFWALRETGNPRFTDQKPRICHTVLLAARTKGQKLFEGSLLTLKHALGPLNIHLADPLLLYGLDSPTDLASQPDAIRAIVEYGEKAGSGA